jgi:AraC-like DNA-binding protein
MDNWLERISPTPRIAGSDSYDTGWVEPLRVIHDPELVLFENGDFELECEGVLHPCKAGTFAIVPPGVWHVTRMRTEIGLRRWMHFEWTPPTPGRAPLPVMTYWPGRPAARSIARTPAWVPAGPLFGPVADAESTRALLARVESLLASSAPQCRALARAVALELLLSLLAPVPAEAQTVVKADNPEESLAHRARHALDAIAYRPSASHPSMRTILGALGRSYESACRAFRAAYGTTPVRYLNALKMEKAKELLATTGMPVAEVARHCGIENPTYFARLHRARFGKPASECRK